MPRLIGWQDLYCPECEGSTFVDLVGLRRHPNGGTAREPKGMVCHQCGSEADPDLMWNQILMKSQQQDIEDYQKQIEVMKETAATRKEARAKPKKSR